MSKNVFLTFILIILSFRADSQTTIAGPDEPDAQKRHSAYVRANRQIYASHEDPGSGALNFSDAKASVISKQLHEMVSKEIDLTLSARKVSANDVTSAISALQGKMNLTDSGPDFTNTPFAKFFSLNGVTNVAVAFVLLQGGDAIPDTQTYLDFYDNASGIWTKKVTAPTLADFEGCSFSVAELTSGLPGEAWFLVWGGPFGSSHNREHMRLYSFDGFRVHTIWKRDNLDALKVKVTLKSAALDYQDFDNVSIEHHEVFHVTPNGLELSSSTQRQID